MKKCKRFNKAIFFPCAVIAAGSVSICATITTTILAERNESDNPIPRKYLLLSDDETILYGFTNKVRQSDIYDYNTLVIPETVTTIAPFAFPYVFDGISTHVKKIVFNEALTTIGNGAFAFCHGLTDTNLYELEQSEKINIANIGDSAFVGSGLTGPLLLPRSIRHIGKRAFAECEFITEVFFPKELESVDEYAFEESGNISKLDFTDLTTIPSWLKLENHIFYGIGKLFVGNKTADTILGDCSEQEWRNCLFNRQSLPNTAPVIYGLNIVNILPEKYFKFDEDDEEKKTLLGFTDEFYSTTSIDKYSQMKIPSSVETIKSDAFKNKITNCHIALNMSNVQTVESSAFEGCNGIQGLLELATIKDIKSKAFYGCSRINQLIIGGGIEGIGDSCFQNCSGMTDLAILGCDSDSTMGQGAFNGCTKLSLIDVASFGATIVPTKWKRDSWNTKPFSNICKTGSIIIAQQVASKHLWEELFDNLGVDGLNQEVGDFADNTRWIFQPATPPKPFEDDDFNQIRSNTVWVGLTSEAAEKKNEYSIIQSPENIKYIFPDAFKEVFVLPTEPEDFKYWEINLSNGVKEIGDGAFRKNDALTGALRLSSELTWVGDEAFLNCNHLRGLFTLPNTITHIGHYAFSGCSLLTTLSSNDGQGTFNLPSELTYIGTRAFEGIEVKKLVLNAKLNSIHEEAFKNMNLKQIDATKISFEQFSHMEYCSESLALENSSGTIYYQKDSGHNQQEWQSLFRNMGLPTGWTVEEIS